MYRTLDAAVAVAAMLLLVFPTLRSQASIAIFVALLAALYLRVVREAWRAQMLHKSLPALHASFSRDSSRPAVGNRLIEACIVALGTAVLLLVL